MAQAKHRPHGPPSRRAAFFFGLVLFCFLADAVPARAAEPPPVASPPVLADGWFPTKWMNTIYRPFERALGDRRRMIQIATLSMCLALYIIWWRRT
jgi:hypothetical protein